MLVGALFCKGFLSILDTVIDKIIIERDNSKLIRSHKYIGW